MSTRRVQSLPCKSKEKRKEKEATSKGKKREKKKKMKKINVDKLMCNYTGAFLSKNDVQIFTSTFSPSWGEIFLIDLGRKHLGATIYFPSSPPNQTHSKKFSFPFSLQNFPSILFHLQTNR